ncbi:MAG: response regulator [Candidatus Pacebacteria bacterium]|nr:response regulator [Candidatus Paceibacterota bacterium]
MSFLNKLLRKKVHHVLLVEDDVPLRRFIADRLIENGVEVIETGDGIVAGQIIAEQQPDCVVLDVMLPGKNGMQILAEMRAVDTQTPVVVLTTLSGEGGLRIEAKKHNAVFLNKVDTSLEIVIDTILHQLGD